MESRILVVDDEPEVARSLIKSIERRDPKILCSFAESFNEAINIFNSEKPQVVLLDLTIEVNTGPESGLKLLDQLFRLDQTTRVIVLTGHAKSENGIEALHRGAFTYLEKPANPDTILVFIKDGIEICNLKRDFAKSTESSHEISTELGITTVSEKMNEVLEQIQFAIKTPQPVLITGETGTGKGVLARLIHKLGSRKSQKFIRYQPSFTNTDLVASEIFGHTKGAFTGASDERRGLLEDADKGTLFIDEIDALPKETQVSLLETLQEKTFRKVGGNREFSSDFRLISALNRDPKVVLEEGTLRVDFFHRIAHCTIELPALRNRRDDIEILAQNCLDRICDKEKLDVAIIEDSAIHQLKKHNWPGNIRELQAVVEGAAFRASINQRKFISLSDIVIHDQPISNVSLEYKSFRERIKSFEEKIVSEALKNAKGNQAQAAKDLLMDRTVFRRILTRINHSESN